MNGVATSPTLVTPRPGPGGPGPLCPLLVLHEGIGIVLGRNDGVWEVSQRALNTTPESIFVIDGVEYVIGQQVFAAEPGDDFVEVASFNRTPARSARLTDGTVLVCVGHSVTVALPPPADVDRIYSSATGWGQVGTMGDLAGALLFQAATSEVWEVGGFSVIRTGTLPSGYWWTFADGQTAINNVAGVLGATSYPPLPRLAGPNKGMIAILPNGDFVYQTYAGFSFFGIVKQAPGTIQPTPVRSFTSLFSPNYLPSPIVTNSDPGLAIGTYSDVIFMGGGIGAGQLFTVSFGSHESGVNILSPLALPDYNLAWQDMWTVNPNTGDVTHLATLDRRGPVHGVYVGDDGEGIPLILVVSYIDDGNTRFYSYDIYEVHAGTVVQAYTIDPASVNSFSGSFGFGYPFPSDGPAPRGVASTGAQAAVLRTDP